MSERSLLPTHRHQESHKHESDADEKIDVAVVETRDWEASTGDVSNNDNEQTKHGQADHDGNPPLR